MEATISIAADLKVVVDLRKPYDISIPVQPSFEPPSREKVGDESKQKAMLATPTFRSAPAPTLNGPGQGSASSSVSALNGTGEGSANGKGNGHPRAPRPSAFYTG
jgi:hypothetical protein